MTEREKQTFLMNAWKKICQWTKSNCYGKFPEGKRFSMPHNPYVWNALVINANGEARIYRGDHSSNNPDYVLTEDSVYGVSNRGYGCLYGNNHMEDDFIQAKSYCSRVIFDELEEIVRRWPYFKEEIQCEMKWSDSIVNFEP